MVTKERLYRLASNELNRRLEAELQRLRRNPNNPIASHKAAEYEKELEEIYKDLEDVTTPATATDTKI